MKTTRVVLLSLVALAGGLCVLLAVSPLFIHSLDDIDMEADGAVVGRAAGKAMGRAVEGVRGTHGIFPYREVKFTAGKDGVWFTEDDEVFHYYLADYNNEGKMTKKGCYKAGPDGVVFTSDDILQDYFLYEYDATGGPMKETYYKYVPAGQDTMGYYSLFIHNAAGDKVKLVRYSPQGEIIRYITYEYGLPRKVLRDVEYKGAGPDKAWLTPDDEIEKYHTREYGPDGRLLRAREFHVDLQGKGPDGAWFTPDDGTSSTRVFYYDAEGRPFRTNKYIGAGPDGVWFTDDDILQYYTVRYFRKLR